MTRYKHLSHLFIYVYIIWDRACLYLNEVNFLKSKLTPNAKQLVRAPRASPLNIIARVTSRQKHRTANAEQRSQNLMEIARISHHFTSLQVNFTLITSYRIRISPVMVIFTENSSWCGHKNCKHVCRQSGESNPMLVNMWGKTTFLRFDRLTVGNYIWGTIKIRIRIMCSGMSLNWHVQF